MKVIYSPNYGAGWSTWNTRYPESAYHHAIINAVEQDLHPTKINEIATQLWPGGSWGAAQGLVVEEVPDGVLFKITVHDGAERLEYVSIEEGFIMSGTKLNQPSLESSSSSFLP